MKQQDKLRESLQSYYDTKQEIFAESDWERAAAVLRSERRSRKTRYAFLAASILFLLSLIVLTPLLLKNEKQNIALAVTKNIKQKDSPISDKNKEFVAAEKKKHNLSLNRNFRMPLRALSDQNKEIAHSDLPPQTGSLLLNTDVDQNPENDQWPGDPAVESTSLPARATEQKQNEDEIAKPEIVPENHKNKSGVNNSEEEKSNKILLIENDALPLSIASQQENKHPEDSQKDKSLIGDTQTDKNEEQRNILNDSVQQTTSTSTSDSSLPLKDSINTPHGPIIHQGVYFELGAAIHYGWKGSPGRDARGISPVAGINYMNPLNERYAVSFGCQYLQVNKLSNSSKTSMVSFYQYGEQSHVTVITPSTLHYLSVPLRLHFFWDEYTSFNAGLNLAYLLNVDANVNTFDQSPGSSDNFESFKQSGYMEGFTWYDSQITLGYSRKIASALGIKVELFQGLIDVKDDRFFNYKNTERNSGLKLSIVSYPFKKK